MKPAKSENVKLIEEFLDKVSEDHGEVAARGIHAATGIVVLLKLLHKEIGIPEDKQDVVSDAVANMMMFISNASNLEPNQMTELVDGLIHCTKKAKMAKTASANTANSNSAHVEPKKAELLDSLTDQSTRH